MIAAVFRVQNTSICKRTK